MQDKIRDARRRLHALGKLQLGFFPTPMHKLERMSEALGVNLWIKREDFSGTSLFGGNKIRKLEYLLSDARAQGCDTVFTYGATQSNHAMETATAARRCGMRPVLYLGAIVEPKPEDLRANLLLDNILGAEVNVLESCGRSTKDTMIANRPLFDAHIARLEREGHKVYDIPVGGSTPRGAAGFAECWLEIMEQAQSLGIRPDFISSATGSGGTLAGLMAGRALCGSTAAIKAFAVGKKDPATYEDGVVDLANRLLELIGAEQRLASTRTVVNHDYVGPGYEKPWKEANDDIRLLARMEGIFTDPVYSGKAFHGLCDQIRKGVIPAGSTVVYIHTGGTTALFAEPEIIGDLNELPA